MKNLVVFIALLSLFSCAGQLKQMPLKMADVSENLASLDNKPDMNFVSKAKISYPKVDVNKFDEFFRKSAAVKGTIVVAKGMVEHEKNLIMNLGKELQIPDTVDIKKLVEELKTKKSGIAKEKIAPIKEALDNMIMVKDLLMGLEGRAKDLLKEGQELVNVAPKELQSDPRKALSVPKALNDSLDNLRGAVSEVPELAKSFAELVDIIKPLVE